VLLSTGDRRKILSLLLVTAVTHPKKQETIASLTPVTYTYPYRCNEVYFFTAIVTPASGYHGIVDISMSETMTNGMYTCKYFGSAVVYKIKPNPFIKETVKYEDVVRKFTPD
jgi:hypothetical protein